MNHYPPFEPKDIVPHADSITIDDCVFKTYLWQVPTSDSSVEWKGRIIFVHGYRDIYKPYHRHFEFLAKNGYDVFFYYQRGEGESKLTTGKRGVANDYYAYKAVTDMINYTKESLNKESRPLNIHLMGHSMGGGIVLNYAIHGELRNDIKSFTTIAPLVTLHKDTDPGWFLEYIVRGLCLTSFGRNLRVSTSLKPHYLTSDDAVAQYIQDNIDIENSDGAFVETRDFIMRGKRLLSPGIYSQMGKDIPILICHGDADSINDYKGSQSFIDKINSINGMKHKEIKIYRNGRHCLHAEIEDIAYPMAKDLLEFINKYN